MARSPVLAAGGIVLRREDPERIALVRLRKRNEWVLPKGKLDNGETPRAAAEREVLEETGHDVCVHEFLGTLVYEAGGRSKVVHYWRMEAAGDQVYELMDDIKAVDWLPLGDALVRLSRSHERAFLENVGPLAVQAAAHARAARRSKAKQPAPVKRRSLPTAVAGTAPVELGSPPTPPEAVLPQPAPVQPNEPVAVTGEAIELAMPSLLPTEPGPELAKLQAGAAMLGGRADMMQKVRGWLRRVIRPARAATSGR